MRKVQNRVYYHCKKMLGKEEDAQDAVQDVLITMITSLDKLREPAAFWGWVNGITANRCRHLLCAPHKQWQIPEDEEGNSMLDTMENLDETLVPEKALDNEETRRMILELVDGLSPEQRMCVLFYYYDEMSVKDIARAMETSEGTVKSRLNYARKAIRAGVEEYERKGIKLYSVSPIVLLVYFLRQEASTCTLEGAAASAHGRPGHGSGRWCRPGRERRHGRGCRYSRREHSGRSRGRRRCGRRIGGGLRRRVGSGGRASPPRWPPVSWRE